MKEEMVQEIIDCLPKGRTPFYYFRDRYALMMLSYYVGEGKRIHDVKKSPLGRLLNKPMVKNAAREAGSGLLTKENLDSVWPAMPECYLLTLGKWGENSKWSRPYYQTSRPGVNLVLQLNFSGKHNGPFLKTFNPKEDNPFIFKAHPNAEDGYHTLAWARIDLDFDTDEALIEEVQSDWIKNAVWEKTYAELFAENPEDQTYTAKDYSDDYGYSPDELLKYVEEVLEPHMKIWDEAMLSAAIRFLREEIGIGRIFFHTFETGCNLKRQRDWKPPRSVYSTLPEKFYFTKTREYPRLLDHQKNRRARAILKSKEARFFRLDF